MYGGSVVVLLILLCSNFFCVCCNSFVVNSGLGNSDVAISASGFSEEASGNKVFNVTFSSGTPGPARFPV